MSFAKKQGEVLGFEVHEKLTSEDLRCLRKKRHEAEFWLDRTQNYLDNSSYDILLLKLEAAKKAGVDVSGIEEGLPELKERFR